MLAAEEIGCTPWELEQQPIYWRDRALIKRQAEMEAKVSRREMQNQMEESRQLLAGL